MKYELDPLKIELRIEENIWLVNYSTKSKNESLILQKEGDRFKNYNEKFKNNV